MSIGWIADVIPEQPVESTWGNSIRDRTVTPFANAAARDTAIPVPTFGMTCALDSDNQIYFYDGTAWSPVGGPAVQPWTGITAGQPGPVSVTILGGRYQLAGAHVDAQAGLRFTSGGASGSALAVTLPPVAPLISGFSPVIGTFRYFRTGVTVHAGVCVAATATTMVFQYNGYGNYLGNGDFIVAINDELQVNLHYEKA